MPFPRSPTKLHLLRLSTFLTPMKSYPRLQYPSHANDQMPFPWTVLRTSSFCRQSQYFSTLLLGFGMLHCYADVFCSSGRYELTYLVREFYWPWNHNWSRHSTRLNWPYLLKCWKALTRVNCFLSQLCRAVARILYSRPWDMCLWLFETRELDCSFVLTWSVPTSWLDSGN